MLRKLMISHKRQKRGAKRCFHPKNYLVSLGENELGVWLNCLKCKTTLLNYGGEGERIMSRDPLY
jgi:hypothetical protein